MHVLSIICALILAVELTFSSLQAQIRTSPQIQTLPPLTKPTQNAPQKTTPTRALPPRPKPIPLFPQQSHYLHPGILLYTNGIWEGNDHLLNIGDNIGVYVTVNKLQNEALNNFSDSQIRQAVDKLFRDAGINPSSMVAAGQPPLPAFEIEILIYPIAKGYVAALEGRLFESVTIPRFIMGNGMAFQAITWDKKSLIVGPIETLNDQLLLAVSEITHTFIERYKAYVVIKKREGFSGPLFTQ